MFVLRKILFYLTAFCTIFPDEALGKGFAVSPLNGNGRLYMDARKARTLFGSEEIYDDIKDITNGDTSYENITPQMKTDRCSSVAGSPLFKFLYQIDSLDPSVDYLNLKQNYSYIYKRLFKAVNSTTDVFSNPLRKYKIVVDGVTLREELFLCLGVNRTSKKVLYYFLSNDYLLNDPNCEYDDEDLSNGFFVFTVNKCGQINLEALAEERAHISDDKYSVRYEDYSLMASSENQSPNELSEEAVNGTICGLNMNQKIRLCTIVLSSVYDGEFVFLPRPESINPSCRRKVTKFPDCNVSEIENNWMIGCTATRTGNNEPAVFYVSPGYEKSTSYDHNDFFIRGPRNEIILLSNINCRINITRRTKFLFDHYFPLTTPIEDERSEKKNRKLQEKGLTTPPRHLFFE